MSDKNSAASSDGDSDTEIEVIEVKASKSLVPNLTISVEQGQQGVEPSVEFHDEDEKMEKEDENTAGQSVDVKLVENSFNQTKKYENRILKEMGLTAEEARLRKQSRAKRFQSPMLREEAEPDEPLKKPTEDFLAKVQEYNKTVDMFQEIRLNAVHLRGLDDMSTEDIFSFFDDFYPTHIEWINDTSCNVVWENEFSAANAIIAMTTPSKSRVKSTDRKPEGQDSKEEPKEEKKKEKDNEDDDLDLMESDEEAMDVEQEDHGKPESEDKNGSETHPFMNELRRCKKPFTKQNKKVLLKMRLATVSDKKTLGGAKKSNYYRKYGNPNYGNMRGLLSRSFMKRFHGRVAHDEFKGYQPGSDEQSNLEKKQKLGKRPMLKEMYSEKAWKDAKKAKRSSGGEEESEESDSSENEEEKQDRELINSSAKDLHDAIPVESKKEDSSQNDSMIADSVSKKVEATRRSQNDAAQSGNLNVKIKGGSSVWSRLGQRPNRDSEGLSRTFDNRRYRGEDGVLEQDIEKRKLPLSLKERLGTRRR